MNRKFRRALARKQRQRITRQPLNKRTHKLTPQTCALWVPDECGYVVEFCPHHYLVTDIVALARHYDEDEAASAALAFREVTGMRVAVRAVYLQPTLH